MEPWSDSFFGGNMQCLSFPTRCFGGNGWPWSFFTSFMLLVLTVDPIFRRFDFFRRRGRFLKFFRTWRLLAEFRDFFKKYLKIHQRKLSVFRCCFSGHHAPVLQVAGCRLVDSLTLEKETQQERIRLNFFFWTYLRILARFALKYLDKVSSRFARF